MGVSYLYPISNANTKCSISKNPLMHMILSVIYIFFYLEIKALHPAEKMLQRVGYGWKMDDQQNPTADQQEQTQRMSGAAAAVAQSCSGHPDPPGQSESLSGLCSQFLIKEQDENNLYGSSSSVPSQKKQTQYKHTYFAHLEAVIATQVFLNGRGLCCNLVFFGGGLMTCTLHHTSSYE